jgi:ParB family chromosome partitioning protein
VKDDTGFYDAGCDRISSIVIDCTAQEMTEKALIENIHEQILSPSKDDLPIPLNR